MDAIPTSRPLRIDWRNEKQGRQMVVVREAKGWDKGSVTRDPGAEQQRSRAAGNLPKNYGKTVDTLRFISIRCHFSCIHLSVPVHSTLGITSPATASRS